MISISEHGGSGGDGAWSLGTGRKQSPSTRSGIQRRKAVLHFSMLVEYFPPDFFLLVCFLLLYKHQDQQQLGEERVCLTYTSRSQAIIAGSQGRNRDRSHLGCRLLACSGSSTFLVFLRPTCRRVVPPAGGWALPHQSTSRRCPYRHAHRPLEGRHTLAEVPTSWVTLVSVKWTDNNQCKCA